MTCTVTDLYTWVDATVHDRHVRLLANNIVSRYQTGKISHSDALSLLSKIDPHIHSFCNSLNVANIVDLLLTSGVYCKCNKAFQDGGIVDTTPVAGGYGLIYETEYAKCVNALNIGQDYYFTKTGKSTECLYIPSEIHDTFCAQSLTGKLATSCGD